LAPPGMAVDEVFFVPGTPAIVAAAAEGAARGGGSRQVVAAAVAAAVRTCLLRGGVAKGEVVEEVHVSQEVDKRVGAIKPVIREQVHTALEGRQAKLSGVTRLRRNVAAHVDFGDGGLVVDASAAVQRRRQRGGRRCRADHRGVGLGLMTFEERHRVEAGIISNN